MNTRTIERWMQWTFEYRTFVGQNSWMKATLEIVDKEWTSKAVNRHSVPGTRVYRFSLPLDEQWIRRREMVGGEKKEADSVVSLIDEHEWTHTNTHEKKFIQQVWDSDRKTAHQQCFFKHPMWWSFELKTSLFQCQMQPFDTRTRLFCR